MGISEGKKKMVAAADHFIFSSARRTDHSYSGFSTGSVYLCDILNTLRSTDLSLPTAGRSMLQLLV